MSINDNFRSEMRITALVHFYSRPVAFLIICTVAAASFLYATSVFSLPIEWHSEVEVTSTEDCTVSLGHPYAYEYNTTVDLRIIVIAFNRPKSVLKTLTALNSLHTDGALVSLDIWIDADKDGVADRKTVEVADNFQFSQGTKIVHVRSKNAGNLAQWFYSWRPKPNKNELALIFDDDITISPYAWRWLKTVHSKYGNWSRVAGYSLECEHLRVFGISPERALSHEDTVYAYRLHGNYGWAPHPRVWRRFQDWLYPAMSDPSFKPYVDGIIPTEWYKSHERSNRAHTMWEMWLICYTHFNNLLTIYSNFKGHQQLLSNSSGDGSPTSGYCLSVHRADPGMHFTGPGLSDETTRSLILSSWSESFERLRTVIKMINYNGDII